MASIAATRVMPAFSAYFDRLLIQRLEQQTPAKTKEESMSQMQPKDILAHLEKGDRTDVFLEARQEGVVYSESSLSDALNMMAHQARAGLGQQQQAPAMSAQMFTGTGLGGTLRW